MSNELLHILLAAKLSVVGCALAGTNAQASETRPTVQSQASSYEVVASASPEIANRAERGEGDGGGKVCC